ncbi:MAG: hypothetical protein ACREND_08165 [Gemmatimonadaceae bacterium]
MTDERPPELATIFDELTRRGPYPSLADANRALERITQQYNSRPQAELGGLSPDQVHRLLTDDWASPDSALVLNASLTLDELASAPLLSDARMLLEYVSAHAPLKETAAHNLPRSAVADIWPRLHVLAERHGYLKPDVVRGPLNEADVYWLAPLRYALMFAGLLTRRKGFRITARGREMLEVERAGALYAQLFRTVFREIDLRLFDFQQQSGLQPTVAYTIFRLGVCARSWSTSETLACTAWLESARDPRPQWEAEHNVDLRHFALENQVLAPLAAFGLLEMRTLPGPEAEPWRETTEYRVAALYDRFLRFDLGERTGSGIRLAR